MKKSLSIGVILLFLLSALAPIGLGLNINTTPIDTPTVESRDYPFENPPNEVWNRTFGGSNHDRGFFLQETSDEGYIIAGITYSFGEGDWDAWLIKTNCDGNEIWNKTYGDRYDNIVYCVRITSDGGLILAGYSGINYNGPYNVWLIKTDDNGDVEWDKKYPCSQGNVFGQRVIELNDGYIIIADIFQDLDSNIWLIKTDLNGNELWNKTIGDFGCSDQGNSIIQTTNGDFLIVGFTYRSTLKSQNQLKDQNNRDILLIRADNNGNKLWRKTYYGSGHFDIIEIDDGYMMAGGTAGDGYLIKINDDGEELWRKNYYRFGAYWVGGFTQTIDGGFILTGSTEIIGNGADVFIFKTDTNGKKLWEIYIGSIGRDVANYIIQSNDGNYVVVGTTESYGAGKWDIWLIKVAPVVNICPNTPSRPSGPSTGRPNVGYDFTTSSSDPDGDIVYYTWDWGNDIIYYKRGPFNNSELCTLEYGWLFWGDYNIRVKAVDSCGGESNWSDPLRITIPRPKTNNDFLLRLLDSYPILKEVLLRLIR
jgi:hypothetical protein